MKIVSVDCLFEFKDHVSSPVSFEIAARNLLFGSLDAPVTKFGKLPRGPVLQLRIAQRIIACPVAPLISL